MDWMPVVGFEDTYSVSDTGLVMRTAAGKSTRSGRVLKPRLNAQDRWYVSLSAGGVQKTLSVAGLVARAFLGPKPHGTEINHIDGDHRNDSAANLEYCTRRENMQHAYRMGLSTPLGIGEDQHLAKLTTEQIIVIRNCTAPIRLLARVFGVSPLTIKRAQTGVTWRHVH